MTRHNPTFDTLRALFAKSGNRCAFPGCNSVLVNERNLFVGQACHIEAASQEGPRFNESQSIDQRRSYDNLILLCYPHHIEIDHDSASYPSSRLKELKRQHERSIDRPYAIDDRLVNELATDMELYWHKVEHANKHEHPATELAVEIDTQASYLSLTESVSKYPRVLLPVSWSISDVSFFSRFGHPKKGRTRP